MSAGLAFRVLGPLEVLDGERLVRIPAGRQSVLLAALLLRVNQTVSIAQLAEALWNGKKPVDSRAAVQKYVMRLRHTVSCDDCRILTVSDGYRLEVPRARLDLEQFESLVERGTRAVETGEDRTASALLGDALGLWRAVPPLANVASEALLHDHVAPLVERYLQAQELRIDVDLRLGRHAQLCAELVTLVRRHPMRERFWAQRMLALHASGRQGEALQAYRVVARMLTEKLGVDPGPELRATHEHVLRGAPSSAWPPRGGATAAPPIVHQLPMATAGIAGRENEISEVVAALSGDPGTAAPRVVVLAGPAGVGKTAVAVHAAHLLAERFVDGQLYAELGATDGRAAEVAMRFLRALGVVPASIPQDPTDTTAMLRSLTAGRRLLVLLDDAVDAEQVRSLLPGTAGCAVIVTSRRDLPDLTVSPGAHPIRVNPLEPADAGAALRAVLGEKRIEAEPDATRQLIERSAGLPLALRVAAAHLAARPDLLISTYLDRLHERSVPRIGVGDTADRIDPRHRSVE